MYLKFNISYGTIQQEKAKHTLYAEDHNLQMILKPKSQ